MNTDKTESLEKFLGFSLGTEEYAIPLLSVKEVIALPEITPVPFSPPHFLGIINLRGQIISVMDLRKKFALGEAKFGEETTLIILNLNRLNLGIVVDSVNRVIGLGSEEISEPPDLLHNEIGSFVTGICKRDNYLVLLLDIVKTLNIEDLTMIETSSKDQAA